MTKAKENTVVNTENLPTITSKDGSNLMELFDNFEAFQTDELQNLDINYLKLTPNSTYNLIFTEIKEFEIQGKTVECAILVDKIGNKSMSGMSVLVNACKKLSEVAPAFIRITTGIMTPSKDGKGKYLAMEVHTI